MRLHKALQAVLMIISVICLVSLVFCGSALYLIFDKATYLAEFEKNRVYENFHGQQTPSTTIEILLEYFKTDSNTMYTSIFTQKEKEHLFDVKIIIHRLSILFVISCCTLAYSLILSYILNQSGFWRYFIGSLSLSGLLIMSIFAVLMLLAMNFEYLFVEFHNILFPQGNWMFSTDSALIRLFPEKTFYDFFILILKSSIMVGTILLIPGIVNLAREKYYINKRIGN